MLASIFAASPSTAGRPVDAAAPAKPNLAAASPAAKDFIRARCEQSSAERPDDASKCNVLLLPYAASINGSYNRAATAGVTAMVAKLTAFADTRPPPLGECIQVVNGAISGAKESFLPKLARLDAMGDDKVDAENQDLVDVTNWISDVNHNFIQKCRKDGDGGSAAAVAAGDSLSTAVGLVMSARPYWDNSLASPDGSGP